MSLLRRTPRKTFGVRQLCSSSSRGRLHARSFDLGGHLDLPRHTSWSSAIGNSYSVSARAIYPSRSVFLRYVVFYTLTISPTSSPRISSNFSTSTSHSLSLDITGVVVSVFFSPQRLPPLLLLDVDSLGVGVLFVLGGWFVNYGVRGGGSLVFCLGL